jgi:subtilisin family serine protease
VSAPLPAWSDAFLDGSRRPPPRLGLPGAITREWAYGPATGDGVKVAIVDSGIEEHPLVGAVQGSIVVEVDADDPEDVSIRDAPHEDLYGHGTACAAIIRTLAPKVELYSVRVLGARLTGKASCFAEGLSWAIDHGMHVINLSMSTTNEDWLLSFYELADRAQRVGAMIVSALANERKTSIPSELSAVFSVAAVATDDPETIYANPSGPADWGARGIDVPVAWKDGSTTVSTGNSFAAPHIAGHIARVLGAHPDLTSWQVKTILAELAAD